MNSKTSFLQYFLLCFCLITLSASASGTIGKAWTPAGKCQAITDWTKIPNLTEFGNLLLDKYFEPVFGVTYREITNESKLKFQKKSAQQMKEKYSAFDKQSRFCS